MQLIITQVEINFLIGAFNTSYWYVYLFPNKTRIIYIEIHNVPKH